MSQALQLGLSVGPRPRARFQCRAHIARLRVRDAWVTDYFRVVYEQWLNEIDHLFKLVRLRRAWSQNGSARGTSHMSAFGDEDCVADCSRIVPQRQRSSDTQQHETVIRRRPTGLLLTWPGHARSSEPDGCGRRDVTTRCPASCWPRRREARSRAEFRWISGGIIQLRRQ